ncbi:ArsR/SmtB family transcription factor [Streptomyces sp. NPDC090798]|uniref:ArsR/SmtB family transcription factor n=1 Tax=Streptomyces sp. NPDC090798 TaxID=3365968 RepID=UPI003812BA41
MVRRVQGEAAASTTYAALPHTITVRGPHWSTSRPPADEHLHKSTVSHHMRIMREAGLTSTRAVGRNRFVRLRRDDLDARFPGLLDALLKSLPD